MTPSADRLARTLVTGASGVLGRAVLAELAARDLPARGLARGAKPSGVAIDWHAADLRADGALATALDGVTTIVHCASNPRAPNDDLVALDRLIAAAEAGGAPHVIYASIAGIERAARRYAYYGAKREAERRLRASVLPVSIVRATQFHPFVAFLLRSLDARVAVVVPRGVRLKPVDVDFVAARLVDTVLAGPSAPQDVCGPELVAFDELAATWLAAQRRRTPVLRVPIPIDPLRAFGELDVVYGKSGGPAWRDWLAERIADRSYNARRD